eukprot:12748487-Alexandrium_andersonii.AAC.1
MAAQPLVNLAMAAAIFVIQMRVRRCVCVCACVCLRACMGLARVARLRASNVPHSHLHGAVRVPWHAREWRKQAAQ